MRPFSPNKRTEWKRGCFGELEEVRNCSIRATRFGKISAQHHHWNSRKWNLFSFSNPLSWMNPYQCDGVAAYIINLIIWLNKPLTHFCYILCKLYPNILNIMSWKWVKLSRMTKFNVSLWYHSHTAPTRSHSHTNKSRSVIIEDLSSFFLWNGLTYSKVSFWKHSGNVSQHWHFPKSFLHFFVAFWTLFFWWRKVKVKTEPVSTDIKGG